MTSKAVKISERSMTVWNVDKDRNVMSSTFSSLSNLKEKRFTSKKIFF